MGQIVPVLKDHLHDLLVYGYRRDEVAVETNSSRLRMVWERDFNIGEETAEVIEFYGKDFNEKHQEEEEHYKFLTHAMLHKINATKYFHNQGLESRKLIVFSDDCISSIHLLVRPESIRINVYMRSSDVIKLLPVDVLALAGLLNTVILKHDIDLCGRIVALDITIGSAHIVTQADLKKATKRCEKMYATVKTRW